MNYFIITFTFFLFFLILYMLLMRLFIKHYLSKWKFINEFDINIIILGVYSFFSYFILQTVSPLYSLIEYSEIKCDEYICFNYIKLYFYVSFICLIYFILNFIIADIFFKLTKNNYKSFYSISILIKPMIYLLNFLIFYIFFLFFLPYVLELVIPIIEKNTNTFR